MFKRFLFGTLIFALAAVPIFAQFDSGSSGADGDLNPTASTSLTCPEPDCVFNFTSINIPAGVTISFRPNRFNTPVTILVQGNVVISGTIDMQGIPGLGANGGLGGPGGFRGGDGGRFATALSGRLGGAGLGPGGGLPTGGTTCNDGRGSFSDRSFTTSGPIYGTPTLLPLIGGSGGAGGKCAACTDTSSQYGSGGGGGGGAILIASSTTIHLNASGIITVRGGNPEFSPAVGCQGAGGSAGAIRLVANAITGNGALRADTLGPGRIRLESGAAIPPTLSIQVADVGRSIHIFQPFAPPAVTIPGIPSLRFAAVEGIAVPDPPLGQFGPTDVFLMTPGIRGVELAAVGIPAGTTIQVTVKPERGGPATTVTSTALNGTLESSTATATIDLPNLGSYFLEARATFTPPTSGAQETMKIDGEKVKQMRIETAQGARSRVIYILESGREFPAEKVGWASPAAKRQP